MPYDAIAQIATGVTESKHGKTVRRIAMLLQVLGLPTSNDNEPTRRADGKTVPTITSNQRQIAAAALEKCLERLKK